MSDSAIALPTGYGKKLRQAFVIYGIQSYLMILFVGGVLALWLTFSSVLDVDGESYAFIVSLLFVFTFGIYFYDLAILFTGRSAVHDDRVDPARLIVARRMVPYIWVPLAGAWMCMGMLVPAGFAVYIVFIFAMLTLAGVLQNVRYASHILAASLNPAALWKKSENEQRALAQREGERARWNAHLRWQAEHRAWEQRKWEWESRQKQHRVWEQQNSPTPPARR